jgi:hypothetical protein
LELLEPFDPVSSSSPLPLLPLEPFDPSQPFDPYNNSKKKRNKFSKHPCNTKMAIYKIKEAKRTFELEQSSSSPVPRVGGRGL